MIYNSLHLYVSKKKLSDLSPSTEHQKVTTETNNS
jgi:hypothetical protein